MADRLYRRQRELSNRALGFWQQNRQDVSNAISGLTATLPDMASSDVWNPNAMKRMAPAAGASAVNAAQQQASLMGGAAMGAYQ